MTTRSILLLGDHSSVGWKATCHVRLGAEVCCATQYCSHVDSLAAEVLTHVKPCGPITLIYTCFTDAGCLEALFYVVQRVVEAQHHETWTGTAENWQLQLRETPEVFCSQNHGSNAADGSTGLRAAGGSSVPVNSTEDVHQLVLKAVQGCQQSTGDGCLVTLTANDSQITTVTTEAEAAEGNAAQLQFLLVPDQPGGHQNRSSDHDSSTSSSNSRSVAVVSKLLAAAGIEAQQLPLSAAAVPEHLPLNIQQLLTQSSSKSSSSSPLLLLLLLPQQIDTLESQQSAARMLQLASACVPAAAVAATTAAEAAAGVKPVSGITGERYSSAAPPRNPAVDRLNKQVQDLQSQLDTSHAHYQQLLDKMVPKWRNDQTALERLSIRDTHSPTATTTTNSSSSSKADPPDSRNKTLLAAAAGAATAAAAAAATRVSLFSASGAPQRPSQNLTAPANDVQQAILEGQLENMKREYQKAKERLTEVENQLLDVTEAAAARELSLMSELKRVTVNANEAGKRAADEKTTLATQVRQLQSELTDLKSSHKSQLADSQKQMLLLSQQLHRQLSTGQAEQLTTPRAMVLEAQREARQQVVSQQQLLTDQLRSLKTQSSTIQEQQQLKLETLDLHLAAAKTQQQQTQQQLQQLQQDAETVWNYALTLNEILCKLEAGHYPVHDTGGLRFYHIPRQDKPSALSTDQIPELAQQLGIAKQHLALLKVAEPGAVFAGKPKYQTAAAAAAGGGSGGSPSSGSRPGSAGRFRPYAYAGVDPVAAAEAAGAHGIRNVGQHGPWILSGTANLVQQHYKEDLAQAGSLLATSLSYASRSKSTRPGSSSSRPHSAATSGRRPDSPVADGAAAAAAGLRLKQQLEKEMQVEMQQRAAAVLAQAGSSAAAAAAAAAGSSIGFGSAGGGATGAPAGDVLALAQYANNLKQQLDKSKEDLQSERRQAADMMIAVRSVQRTQAAAAATYLAGVSEPASPSRPSSALGSPKPQQQQQQQQPPVWAGSHSPSRPASALSTRQQQQQQQQQQQLGSPGMRPASLFSRPGSAPGFGRPQSARH